jgi:hypothetical protein
MNLKLYKQKCMNFTQNRTKISEGGGENFLEFFGKNLKFFLDPSGK